MDYSCFENLKRIRLIGPAFYLRNSWLCKDWIKDDIAQQVMPRIPIVKLYCLSSSPKRQVASSHSEQRALNCFFITPGSSLPERAHTADDQAQQVMNLGQVPPAPRICATGRSFAYVHLALCHKVRETCPSN